MRILIAATLALSPLPAIAQETVATPSVAVAEVAVKTETKDPVVCKRQETTGSRLQSKRVCMTQSQWDIQKRETEQLMRQRGDSDMGASRQQ